MELSSQQIRQLRMRSQLLDRDPGSKKREGSKLLQSICAVQAQDARAAELSLWTRGDGLTVRDVRRARADDHAIVRTWLMRGTLHFAAAEDLEWMLPVLGERFIKTSNRRYEQLGLDEDVRRESLLAIQEILKGQGQVTRSELIARLTERGFPTGGQAAIYLISHAGLNGVLSYGPDQDDEETYVLLDEWIGTKESLPHDLALQKLALRYINAYAPAGVKDLASWSGLTLTKSRTAIDSIRDQLVEVKFNGESLWMLETEEDLLSKPSRDDTNVALLPRYDTYLMGYQNRDLIVPHNYSKQVHPGGGILHPVILVNGVAVGTWKTDRKKSYQVLKVAPFEDLEDAIIDGIETQAKDMARFLDVEIRVQIQGK